MTKSTRSPVSAPDKIDIYAKLKQRIYSRLRVQHPEWILSSGDCPTCESYESRLALLLNATNKNNQSARADN